MSDSHDKAATLEELLERTAEHPSEDALILYSEGLMDDADLSKTKAHLADCDTCTEVLENIEKRAAAFAGDTPAAAEVPVYIDWSIAAKTASTMASTTLRPAAGTPRSLDLSSVKIRFPFGRPGGFSLNFDYLEDGKVCMYMQGVAEMVEEMAVVKLHFDDDSQETFRGTTLVRENGEWILEDQGKILIRIEVTFDDSVLESRTP